MKRAVFFILIAALLLCGCGKEPEELGEWTLPSVEGAPTVQTATASQSGTATGAAPVKYVWNEALSVDMSDPGAAVTAMPSSLSHAETLSLFGGQFLPMTIFGESYGNYERRYLEQVKHDVLCDESGALAENAYIEYRYMNKAWVESKSITVMAERCSFERVQEICNTRGYPHIRYAEGTVPQMSGYYLESFVLAKCGETRYAQWLVLPDSYFSYAARVQAIAEELDKDFPVQPLTLLTFTCQPEVSDGEFIDAVCAISQASKAAVRLPDPEKLRLPAPGEKGAA